MDVFVYGTLTEPDRVAEVLDSFVFVGAATLIGLRPVEGRYPTLRPGGETAGRLLRTDEIAALDRYERVADGLYRRVSVPLDASAEYPDEAAVYIGPPDRLGMGTEWPKRSRSRDSSKQPDLETRPELEDAFADRVSAYLEQADVRVRLTPQKSV